MNTYIRMLWQGRKMRLGNLVYANNVMWSLRKWTIAFKIKICLAQFLETTKEYYKYTSVLRVVETIFNFTACERKYEQKY